MAHKKNLRPIVLCGLFALLSLSAWAEPIIRPIPPLPTPVDVQVLGDQRGTYVCVNNNTHRVVRYHWCFCPTEKIVRGPWVCELTSSCTPCPQPRGIGEDIDPICGDASPGRSLDFLAPAAQMATINEAQSPQECWEQGGVSFTDDLLRETTTCYVPVDVP